MLRALAALARSARVGPGVVIAEVPKMALGIAARKVAAVALLSDRANYVGARRLRLRMGRVDIADDDVGALGGAAERRRRRLQLAEIIFARRAEHDHAVAEGEFGVGDAAAAVVDDHAAFESERLAQPVDHLRGIAITHRRNNRSVHVILSGGQGCRCIGRTTCYPDWAMAAPALP